jgi:hypothetical protein
MRFDALSFGQDRPLLRVGSGSGYLQARYLVVRPAARHCLPALGRQRGKINMVARAYGPSMPIALRLSKNNVFLSPIVRSLCEMREHGSSQWPER